ncbi:GNAT family N-acetyltransferase [Microbacterium sp. H1-D42]|uniref:GNAT family N-acetyltransferase n=1 Tax=Microbacterium sp. H1-D42 TaxID=2925844 RepID=UPI001F5342DF|nr:GNAT family N-acetyltransferase [Microbacterium sp. H1-D42]UNK70257.1 N-acetyltransferase [Microbacterium sp. H1-D42]
MTSPAAATDFVLVNEKDAGRFTLTRGGVLVSVLDYRDDGSTVALTRAFTIPTYRGHGYAAMVTAGAVADIETRGDRRVDPVCWYVAEWFEDHPEKQHLLRTR